LTVRINLGRNDGWRRVTQYQEAIVDGSCYGLTATELVNDKLMLYVDLYPAQRYITVTLERSIPEARHSKYRPPKEEVLEMYALILAGGKGERLRPLTDSLPKPLVPLDNKPILWHQVEWLKNAGVTNVIFLVGYRWEMVREYFGDGSGFGIKPVYSVETSPLGRGGAIRLGLAHVPEEEDTVFVLNGDIITDQDPASLLNHHVSRKQASSEHLATIMVVPMVSPYGLVDLDENSDVVGFREKVTLPHWINAGVYVFDRAIGPLMPELGDHEDHTFPLLAKEGRISAYQSSDFWRSVDSLKDLREAEDHVREAKSDPAVGVEGSTQ